MRGSRTRRIWTALIAIVIVSGLVVPGWTADDKTICAEAENRWEQALHDLKQAVADFEKLRETPVAKIIQRPIVDRAVEKSIAAQVSDAMEAKEKLLDEKRESCRSMMTAEEQAFNALDRCMAEAGEAKGRDFRRLTRKRERVVKSVRVKIALVREVEGKDDYSYYADSWRNPNNYYNQNMNQYWRSYQRMYQQYWGR